MEIDTKYLKIKRVTYTFDKDEIFKALASLKGFSTYIDFDHIIELNNGDDSMDIMPYVKITIDIPELSEDQDNDIQPPLNSSVIFAET